MRLKKLNKKADMAGGIEILVSGLALTFIFIMFFFIIGVSNKTQEFSVNSDLNQINNDKMLLTFLRSPIDDTTVVDKIIESRITKKYNELIPEISIIMRNIYAEQDEEPCWTIHIDDEELTNPEECDSRKTDIKTKINIPTPDNKLILFKLEIK